MSDKAYRDDGFDVLESIRRLVSDTPSARRDLGEAASADKLLLTPALRVAEPELVDEDAGPAPEPETGWSLEARIAELEAAVGSRPDEWEPDGSEDADQETPRRFVFQHRPLPLSGREADRSAFAARAAEIASAEAPELDDEEAPEIDFTEDTPLPDAEALRDLVAEIVRQELQGELGMRVTRNIRKLVRREIQRALMSKEFDD